MELARAIERAADARAGQGPKPKKKSARLWWNVHQWVGLKLSLFMTFILFTGTLAVVSHEIDWLLQPSLRVAPASVEGPPDWARIAQNAAAHPRVDDLISLEGPVASAFAVKVIARDEDGRYFFLHAHPSTGEIQGEAPWVGAQRILRNMHRHLNLPTAIGVPIVSALAFLLLISLVTSFVVYKKWWRGFAKPIRSRDARTWWGDFHRLAGVWSLWFVALIALTSVWYFVESVGLRAPPPPSVEREETTQTPTDFAGLERAVEAGLAAYPGLAVERVMLPGPESPVLQLHGQHEAILVRARANTAWVDTRTADVLLTTDGRDLGVHQRIGEMADPLHFGTFGGYWTKIPWFVFGLAMTGLALSGAAIYSLRIARDRSVALRLSRAFSGMWVGMGRWRWLSVALILVGFALLPVLFTF